MAILLPPSLSGPVYTFSTVAKVSGALKGATVQAFKNGVAVGNPGVADNLGFAAVTFAAGALSLGDALTATQSKDGAQSQRGPGTTVLGVPGSLAPPIFLSRIHTCMDAVLLGGLPVNSCLVLAAYLRGQFDAFPAVHRQWFDWIVRRELSKSIRSQPFGLTPS